MLKKSNKFIWILEIFLILIVPILTIGFDLFEDSKPYKSLFGFYEIEEAISNRFSSQYEIRNYSMIYKHIEPELFYPTYNLIRKYTFAKLPSEEPFTIGRLNMKNAAYIKMPPNDTRVFLVPESIPIFLWYENPPHGINIGTLADFKDWYYAEKNAIRIKVNLSISILSIFIGLYIHFSNTKE